MRTRVFRSGSCQDFRSTIRPIHRRANTVLPLLVILFTATNLHAQVLESFAEPVELREVAAAEPGVVSKTFVREGQSIEIGQVLAELQCEELRQKKRLAELRAESAFAIQAADALVRIREKKLAALRPMLESGHANQSEVEQAELEFDAAFSEREAAKLAREEQKIQVCLIEAEIERRLIRSPIRGVITEVHRQAGEFIAGAEPKFATIADLTKLRARFYLNAEEAIQLKTGQNVTIATGLTQKIVHGTVSFVSPVTDADSSTTRVEVLLNNPQNELRSGSPCRWIGPESGRQKERS